MHVDRAWIGQKVKCEGGQSRKLNTERQLTNEEL